MFKIKVVGTYLRQDELQYPTRLLVELLYYNWLWYLCEI